MSATKSKPADQGERHSDAPQVPTRGLTSKPVAVKKADLDGSDPRVVALVAFGLTEADAIRAVAEVNGMW